MYDEEFDAPATHWVVLTVVGGLLTGIGLIVGLESLRDRCVYLYAAVDYVVTSVLLEVCVGTLMV